MKILVDGKQVLELTETQKQVIKNDIPTEIFQEDMERRVGWNANKEISNSFRSLKSYHDDKLISMGITSVPLDEESYADIIFSNENYKSMSRRIYDEKKKEIDRVKALLDENRSKFSSDPDFIKKEAEVLAKEEALGVYVQPEFRESIIKVDDKEVFRVNANHKKILAFTNTDDEIDKKIDEGSAWILTHKYERCFERLKNEWDKKLLKPIIDPVTKAETPRGVSSIPLDKDAYATLVFSQPDYKNRSARELEAEQ